MSDLVPHLAGCVDEIAFLPAMVSKSNVHGPATFLQTTGFVLPGFPGMGAWMAYGLGSRNARFVVDADVAIPHLGDALGEDVAEHARV